MARKTFISYKYSESQNLRDRIIKALGEDASYYKGETSDSPDLTDNKTSTIKKKLSDMLFDTSITIVILSPNMKESKWIDWEVKYSIRKETRNNRQSQPNGIVLVKKSINGNCGWLDTNTLIGSIKYNEIINYLGVDKSKVILINETSFLADPNYYIEKAYEIRYK